MTSNTPSFLLHELQFDYVNERLFRSRLCPVPNQDATLVDRFGFPVTYQVRKKQDKDQSISLPCYSFHMSPEIRCHEDKLDVVELGRSHTHMNAHWTSVIARDYVPYNSQLTADEDEVHMLPTFESMMDTANEAYDLLGGLQADYDSKELSVVVRAMLMEMLRVYLVHNQRWIEYKPCPSSSSSSSSSSSKFQYKYPPYLCLIYHYHDFEDRSSEMGHIDIVATFADTICRVTFLTFAVMVFKHIKQHRPDRYPLIVKHWPSILKYIRNKPHHNRDQWLSTSRFSEVFVSNLIEEMDKCTQGHRGHSQSCVRMSTHKSYAGTWKHVEVRCIENGSIKSSKTKSFFESIPKLFSHLKLGPAPDMTYGCGYTAIDLQLSQHMQSNIHVVQKVLENQTRLLCNLAMVLSAKDVKEIRRVVNLDFAGFMKQRADLSSACLLVGMKRSRGGGNDDKSKNKKSKKTTHGSSSSNTKGRGRGRPRTKNKPVGHDDYSHDAYEAESKEQEQQTKGEGEEGEEEEEQEEDEKEHKGEELEEEEMNSSKPSLKPASLSPRVMCELIHPSRLRYVYYMADEMVYASTPFIPPRKGHLIFSVSNVDEPEYSPLGLSKHYWEWAKVKGESVYFKNGHIADGQFLRKSFKPPTDTARHDPSKNGWIWNEITVNTNTNASSSETYYYYGPSRKTLLFETRIRPWLEAGGRPRESFLAMDALCCLIDTSEEDVYATLIAFYGPRFSLETLQTSYRTVKRESIEAFNDLATRFSKIGEWVSSVADQDWNGCSPPQPSAFLSDTFATTAVLSKLVRSRISYRKPPEYHMWRKEQVVLAEENFDAIIDAELENDADVLANYDGKVDILYVSVTTPSSSSSSSSSNEPISMTVFVFVNTIRRIVLKYVWTVLLNVWRFRFPASHVIRMGPVAGYTWAQHRDAYLSHPRLYQFRADLISHLSDPHLIKEVGETHRYMQDRQQEASAESSLFTESKIVEVIENPTSWGHVPQYVSDSDLLVMKAALTVFGEVNIPSKSATSMISKLKDIKQMTDAAPDLFTNSLHAIFNQVKGELDHQHRLTAATVEQISKRVSICMPSLENHIEAFVSLFNEMVRRSDLRARPLSQFAYDNQQHSNQLVSTLSARCMKELWFIRPSSSSSNNLVAARALACKNGITKQ